MASRLLFDACISVSKKRETGKRGEDREEFHFEVAEGRRQGAEGGRYVYVRVQENKGGVFPAA